MFLISSEFRPPLFLMSVGMYKISKQYALLILLIMVSSCRTIQCDTANTTERAKVDSTEIFKIEKHYEIIRDSIFLTQKNDTVIKEIYRTRYIEKHKTDTIRTVKRDTVIVTKTVEKAVKNERDRFYILVILLLVVSLGCLQRLVKQG